MHETAVTSVMVPMRDGIRLSTDVYRPAGGGHAMEDQFPTLLLRTPYDKAAARYGYLDIPDFFTPRGYVVVLQDVRERHRSEGTNEYVHVVTPNQGRDGYDTIEWIAAQPWSSGRIGMVGSSYAALTQTRAALERPPHLSAIWPDVTATSTYRNVAREGGAMQLQMFWSLLIHAQDAQDIADDPDKRADVWNDIRRMRELLRAIPWRPGQLSLRHVPALEGVLFDYYRRGCYDDWWAQESNDLARHFDRHADIPAVYSTGWFDMHAGGPHEYFAAMAKQNETPQGLVVGPWDHRGMRADATFTLDVDFGRASVWGQRRYFEEQLRFFDRFLRDKPADGADVPPVRIFVMGGGSGRRTRAGKLDHGGRWRAEREWPLARTSFTPYYLHADGSLGPEPPHLDISPRTFSFDPSQPVPSLGGQLGEISELPPDETGQQAVRMRYGDPLMRMRRIVAGGPAHQREVPDVFGAQPPCRMLSERPDVLVFQTRPLDHPVELTGEAVVHLWIASSAADTDFTAKLIDVYPANADYLEGYHLGLCDSVFRCRFREGWDHAAFLKPGVAYEITIKLPPTSNLFAAGHRIRVDVSSSNFPRLDVNPNTGEPLGRHTYQVVAQQTVFVDGRRASHVLLPIIPD